MIDFDQFEGFGLNSNAFEQLKNCFNFFGHVLIDFVATMWIPAMGWSRFFN